MLFVGKVLFASDVGSPPSLADHPLTGLHHVITGGRGCVSALLACRWTLCHCCASCTKVTPSSPEMEVPPQRLLMHECRILDVFCVQGGGRIICDLTYMT